MSLTHDDIRKIAADTIAMDLGAHTEDHRYVRTKREGEAELRKLKNKILASLCIWAIPLILTYVVVALWNDVVAKIAAVVK
jgi:hypothetical protein